MASAASIHADMEWEESRKKDYARFRKQYEALGELYRTVGFGPHPDDASWVQKQIHDHLTAAYSLTELLTLKDL